MTTRPQWHASSEKNRMPGLHRPPGHSKSRSSEHMESMGPREEHWKSSIYRRFCCVLCASSSLPTCSPYPGHVDALSNASTARCTVRLSVHKYDSVRHDQREPSAVSVHDEHETGEFVRRPARHEARLHHQEHQRSAIGASPRPSIHMPRLDSAVLQSLRRRSRGHKLQVTTEEKKEA